MAGGPSLKVRGLRLVLRYHSHCGILGYPLVCP
jgi:hypothetical protein